MIHTDLSSPEIPPDTQLASSHPAASVAPFTKVDIHPSVLGTMMPPPIQLASSDPFAWEAKWAQVFVSSRSNGLKFEPSLEACTFRNRAKSSGMQDPRYRDELIRCTRTTRKNLCFIQTMMNLHSLPDFRNTRSLGWRQKWMSATPAKRGEAILKGLVATCSAMPVLHDARWLCEKEMTVESHRQNGRLFIDLWEEMSVQHTSPETPNYISNLVWDEIIAEQQSSSATICEKVLLANCLADRNGLIAFVLYHAFCWFLDLQLPEFQQKKLSFKPKKAKIMQLTQSSQVEMDAKYGKETTQGVDRALREVGIGMQTQAKDVYDNGKQYCQTCLKPNDTKKKYPRCKRCWDVIDREILYCSPECQKVDWKAGHKKECGKWLRLEDLTPSTPEQSPLSTPPPPSAPGSVALNALCTDCDYIISLEKNIIYLSFPYPPIRAAFRACKEKALTTRDRRAVAMLAHFLFLVSRTKTFGVAPSAIMAQMSTAFDFPDIILAVEEMEEQMAADFGLRPPILVAAGVSLAEWQEALPSGWVEVKIVEATGMIAGWRWSTRSPSRVLDALVVSEFLLLSRLLPQGYPLAMEIQEARLSFEEYREAFPNAVLSVESLEAH
ncbi:hypothetical protein FB45DRAFT_1058166 [Roridomyces roridus]|uniref:MYND-type domain-containing protein n=1 Tax=Roridomyces roridus TaxID=1738132 RepID=A0AAD7FMY6_9AGAR|nr:hypothetical protein FB45DRAFT_1058166 [Roridomyces roridus]